MLLQLCCNNYKIVYPTMYINSTYKTCIVVTYIIVITMFFVRMFLASRCNRRFWIVVDKM